MAKELNTRDLKTEARSRFERYITLELDAKPDVGTAALAENFYASEERLLKKLGAAFILNILVKWADDILNQSAGREAARNGHAQLLLPLSLQGIDVPGALSFVNGANKLRFVANYKAVWFHVDSHAYLMRKHDEDVHASRMEFEKLHGAVRPYMERSPDMRLSDALKKLITDEGEA